ncbi:phage tail tape measure protein [Capnocytophaga canis]|uniref:phage tail tape measure protein n=1 Tax=Capnocytophaga canis TaxID=1848903 RepID=UPI001561D84E|nr:phage tail tape measure protein [Capnocytophaga canis]
MTLLIDLSKKLFDSKIGQMQRKFGQTVKKMKVDFKEFTDQIPMLGGALDLFSNKWVLLGAGLTAFGTLAAKGVQSAQKFDEAFLPIRNLNLDKSKAELDGYRNQIRDAAFELGTNLADSTNAVYDLQSATGLYGKDAIDIFKKVGTYSSATGAKIGDAMNSTTKAMKAFRLGVGDIDKLLESNAKTVQVGITTFDELAKVQTEYAGAASSAGQGVDTANKVFAMFTSVAKNSDIGANLTKTFFQGLGQQADKFKEVLQIDVFDKKGSMRSADLILKDISAKFKGMSDKQITEAINKIGGPEGLRGALDKVKTGADDMIATFNAFDSSQFSLSEAMENANGDISKMKEAFSNRLETLLSKFGEKFYPLIAGIFDKLNPVLEWLYNNFDTVSTVLGTFAVVLGVVTAATWAWSAALYANPVGLIIAAIAAMIALIVVAVKKFDQWGAGILALLGPIGWLIIGIKTLYKHWEDIKKAFTDGGIIEGLKRIGLAILDMLLVPVQQLLEVLSYIPGLGDLAGKGAEAIASFRDKLELSKNDDKKTEEDAPEDNPFSVNPNPITPTGNPLGNSGNTQLGNQVSKVTGDATQTKNITIHIGTMAQNTFEKGTTNGLTWQQVEERMNDILLRVVRNAELS